jgi:3'-phosphoadenosine 5'-phosphosulfate sulfotransferase (PAPS reductase)/FAD synthetase
MGYDLDQYVGHLARNPFELPLPAACDVSGGRTSAMMLRLVLDSHGGQPDGLHLLFCNTGKEREETYDFVRRMETEWGCRIVWLEYRYRDGAHAFDVVDYGTASRHGEPFEQVIRARNDYRSRMGKLPMLPNVVMRFCTSELKIRTKRRYMESVGFGDHRRGYHHAVGLRADEMSRVYRLTNQCGSSDDCGVPLCPLAKAGIDETDVRLFWDAQPFDLALESYEGNCDFCFLKSQGKIFRLANERRSDLAWWAEMERRTGAVFRRDRPTYTALASLPLIPTPPDDADDEPPCHCTD